MNPHRFLRDSMNSFTFDPTSLRNRSISASIWTGSGFAIKSVLQLVSNLILTRILFPEAFGLMAIANTLLIGLAMFSDAGIQAAIVQHRRGEDTVFLNTAWTIQIARGFFLWSVAIIIAWPAAKIYDAPLLFPLLSVLGATVAINGFASTGVATAERRLRLGVATVVQTIGQAATLIFTALMAWYLRSIWALAFGAIAGATIQTTLSHRYLSQHRHRLTIDKGSLSELFKFGRWIFISTIVTYLGNRGIAAIQAFFLPLSTLGILAIAQTFALMPLEFGAKILSKVAFPALSEVNNKSPNDFANAFGRVRPKVLVLTVPIFLLLALISVPLIRLLYDPRYVAAGQYLAILSVVGVIQSIGRPYQNAFLALGNSKLNFFCVLFLFSFRTIFLIIGYRYNYIIGMLIGLGIGTIITYIFVAINAWRLGFLRAGSDIAILVLIGIVSTVTWWLYF